MHVALGFATAPTLPTSGQDGQRSLRDRGRARAISGHGQRFGANGPATHLNTDQKAAAVFNNLASPGHALGNRSARRTLPEVQ
eukprot:1678598-Alexandrium_andersonii.AAC.1